MGSQCKFSSTSWVIESPIWFSLSHDSFAFRRSWEHLGGTDNTSVEKLCKRDHIFFLWIDVSAPTFTNSLVIIIVKRFIHRYGIRFDDSRDWLVV